MSQFALIWINMPKEVEVAHSDYETLKDYCESPANDPAMNQGFTLYDAVSLKEVFSFNQAAYKVPGLKDYTIRDLALLFETQRVAIVFDHRPK